METKTFDWKVVAVTTLLVILASCQVPGDDDSNVQINETAPPQTNDSETVGDRMLVNLVDDQEIRYDPEILTAFETNDEVPVVVDVRHPPMPPVPEDQTLEEFKALVAEQRRLKGERTDAVLATLSDVTTQHFTKLLTEDGFLGNVTMTEFEKLTKNPDVEAIYWGERFYLEYVYEEINNKPDIIIDSGIVEALEVNDEVTVMVDIWDSTGPVRTRRGLSQEEWRGLFEVREQIRGKRTDAVLHSLTEEESKRLKKFTDQHGFYGNVTRETYEKLIAHPDVAAIRMERMMELY